MNKALYASTNSQHVPTQFIQTSPGQFAQTIPVQYNQNVPVQFNYSQVSPHPSRLSQSQMSHNLIINGPHPSASMNFLPKVSPIHHPETVNLQPPSRTNSQILYRTQPIPVQQFPVSFHNQPIYEPVTHINPNVIQYLPNPQQTTVRPNLLNRNLSQFRRNVSPINSARNQKPHFHPIQKDKELEKYDALRWQNKYEDLKTKYFQLLSIVQNNDRIEDYWLLQEENKLLKSKIKLLQESDQKYYNQVASRVEKLVDFHKQTTTQQCALLIDRFRLENKFLSKI